MKVTPESVYQFLVFELNKANPDLYKDEWEPIDLYQINGITQEKYTGSIGVILKEVKQIRCYTSRAWYTYKEIKQAGGHIIHRRYVKLNKNLVLYNGNDVDIPFKEKYPYSHRRRPKVDKFLQSLSECHIVEDGEAPYFNEEDQTLHVPNINQFKNSSAFYNTVFHELGHWTGTSYRLNRRLHCSNNTLAYCKEEAVAELTAVLLCYYFKLPANFDMSFSYIKGWLRDDRYGDKLNSEKYLRYYATKASDAYHYILNSSN